MTMDRQTIASALDALAHQRQYDNFQDIAFHLAKKTWPGLHLTHKIHDLGADAIDETTKMVLAVGWNGEWSKFKGDCKTIKRERPEYQDVILATSLAVSEQRLKNWKEEAEKLDVKLLSVIHRDRIIGELERPENWWIAHRYLKLPISNFADMVTQLPRIRNAAHRLHSSWLTQHPLHGVPHLDLRVQSINGEASEKPSEFTVSEISSRIDCADVVWVTGPPGIGKTQTLLDIADSLLSGGERIPLLMSLRSWAMQEDRLVDFLASSIALSQENIQSSTLAFAIEAGHVVLMMNGWNEIPNDRQERLKTEFRDLLGESGGATIVVTSRYIPEKRWQRCMHQWRLCDLNGKDIARALALADVPSAPLLAEQIADNWQLAEIASVPLFLWELAAVAQMGQSLPSTRFALMKRLVDRACSEHEDAIRIEGQIDIALRILGALAVWLTDSEKTEESIVKASPTVAKTIVLLEGEGLLGNASAPPTLLTTLSNCHLLTLEEGGSNVRFSHQLVQEFFCAQELARLVAADEISATDHRLSEWAWAVPIQMSVEHLSSDIVTRPFAISLVERILRNDLDAACRAVGLNPELWNGVSPLFEERILSLSNSNDINARWIAARSAAATGQTRFSDIVFDGLAGYPADSGSVFTGIPTELVFRSLGSDFSDRVINHENEDFRFRVLNHLGSSGTQEGIRLAKELARGDSAPIVRCSAYQILLSAGDTASWRPFLVEVKRQGGWDSGLLAIARHCDLLSEEKWRELQHRLVESKQEWKERQKAFIRWAKIDREGASRRSMSEYEWCCSQPTNPQALIKEGGTIQDYRLYCLRVASKLDPEWAADRTLEESSASGFDQIGAVPIEALSAPQKAKFVINRIAQTIGAQRYGGAVIKRLARIDPKSVSCWILQKITTPNFPQLNDDSQRAIQDALRHVERSEQIRALCLLEFDHSDEKTLERVIRTTIRGRGDQRAVLTADLREVWRKQLGHWMNSLRPLDHTCAATWSNLAVLIGELGEIEDAPLLINLLKQDAAQLQRRIKQRKAEVEAYRATGRRSKAPGSIACSFQTSYHRTLWELKGDVVCQGIKSLLNDPKQASFAGHWLATHFGAPQAEESRVHRYDLIQERRHRTAEFKRATASILAELKQTIDSELDLNGGADFQELGSSLHAVARLEGSTSGAWIMDRLERHFPDRPWDRLLHHIILVGAEVPGIRLLPFARRAIHEITHPTYHPSPDERWRARQILTVFFYTDAPKIGTQLLGEEAVSIFRSDDYELASLIESARWAISEIVDEWLESFLDLAMPEQTRSTAMKVIVDRAANQNDYNQLPLLARKFIALGDLRRSEGAWSISRKLAEMMDGHPGIQSKILAEATTAPTIEHAQRWLILIGTIDIEESIFVALDLAEQWGEAEMEVLCSLYPDQHNGKTISFRGCFANWRRSLHLHPKLTARLQAMKGSPDPLIRERAQRALYWFERERLGGGA